MQQRLPKFPAAVAAVCLALALVPAAALAGSSSSNLAGTWSGTIPHAMKGDVIQTVHIRIVINTKQTGGTWYVNASCHGPLSNDGISWGYHHYIEQLAKGSTCIGGATDCLQRQSANVFDNVTPPATVSYSASATLKRVKTKTKTKPKR